MPQQDTPLNIIYSKACQGDGDLELLFTAPPNCPLEAHLFFADVGHSAGMEALSKAA